MTLLSTVKFSMVTRTRRVDSPIVNGVCFLPKHPDSSSYRNWRKGYDQCVDEVKYGDGGDLTITHATLTGNTLNGKIVPYNGFWGDRIYTEFPLSRYSSTESAWFQPLIPAGRPTNSELATRLLASTNPSRPDVDIPVLIGEIGELPMLVKGAGETLLGKAASGNIKLQFGILPLADDLASLLEFGDLVNKRVRELEALQESGLRRTRTLWRGSIKETVLNVATNSSPTWTGTIRHDTFRTTTVRTWGHVKWYPIGPFPKGDLGMHAKAVRAVGGLTADASTAWELIPFSWLADYYTNIGDYLKANRNIVSCGHSVPQIMDESATVSTGVQVAGASYLGANNPRCNVTVKKRRTASASLSASLPFLSARQLSILGSLWILRSGKY